MIRLQDVAKRALPHVEELELDRESYLFGIEIASEICLLQKARVQEITEEDLKDIVQRAMTQIID